MVYVLSNANVFIGDSFEIANIYIDDGTIIDISQEKTSLSGDSVYNFKNCYVFPGFLDVHVHLREPGFLCKETIRTGTMAAARGGYTSVCSMPNLNPRPDNCKDLKLQKCLIEQTAVVNVYPYGAITKGEYGKELSDMENLSPEVVGFTDDGRAIKFEYIMLKAMKEAKKYDKIIAAHCEDMFLVNGGYIHAGYYAKLHNHRGIPSSSEYKQVERDLKIAKETGCKYHICHVSTKESVELIRNAKKDGVDVTCETAPHYLLLNDTKLKNEGRFKMNPPIREEEDRLALIEGIKDGTIDMIATDHAPHTAEEKSKGLKGSCMGIVGLETAFPLLYTYLVRKKIITLEHLIKLMNINPRKRFNIGTSIEIGQKADLTVFDLKNRYEINSADFLSKGKSTPFDGYKVFGKCKFTTVGGTIAYKEREF